MEEKNESTNDHSYDVFIAFLAFGFDICKNFFHIKLEISNYRNQKIYKLLCRNIT